MKVVSFNQELIIANTLFETIFNDIIIKRFDKDGNVIDNINVPVRYGNRSRALKNIENKSKNLTMPIIIFKRNSLTRFSQRSFNIHDDLISNVSTNDPTKRSPVPVELEYEVNIITEFGSDEDQIIQNLIPYFNNHIFVSWEHPYTNDIINNKIVWDGSFTTPKDDVQVIDIIKNIATAAFKVHTWLFAGTPDSSTNEKLIETIKFSILDSQMNEINGGFVPVNYSEDFTDVEDILIDQTRVSDNITYSGSYSI